MENCQLIGSWVDITTKRASMKVYLYEIDPELSLYIVCDRECDDPVKADAVLTLIPASSIKQISLAEETYVWS